MNPHFLRNAAIALLALVAFLPCGVEVSSATDAAALSPPSLAVLYEEDPIPGGTSAAGSVKWGTEMMMSLSAGKAAELTVRADIEIPERKLEMIWRLRRDDQSNGSVSHTIECFFKLPPDFPSGGIFNVPSIWMKPADQGRGTRLTGGVVKVATGFFLIGLSAAPANIQPLKDLPWFAIPIVYTNNRRAILLMEKGTTGAQAFQQAFVAWNE
jgi:hypothetical protein